MFIFPIMANKRVKYSLRQPASQREKKLGANVVTTLTQPWYRSGRNILGDSLFTSFPLAEQLLSENMTYVGTLRKIKVTYQHACPEANEANCHQCSGLQAIPRWCHMYQKKKGIQNMCIFVSLYIISIAAFILASWTSSM
jgi:hypothetical protein